MLGQQATGPKSNEINAIPLLLERLHLTGARVTIDAMGTRTKIAEAILARGADDLLALKDNQRSLADEVALYFDSPEPRAIAPHETVDADHGRLETRRHRVSHDVAWLNGTRRAPGEPRFPGLKAIAMVEAITERDGKVAVARRFFLSPLQRDAPLLARAVRAHPRHREPPATSVLDVVFHDDLMRLRTDNGPQDMATIKHMAMNPIRQAPGKDSLKVRRKNAGWDTDYLRAIITRTPQ